ncbi:DUF1772 domain-containing protein [Aspergillus ibericus CBS 121593]|uniref:DUF1772-domain-containing protein n=1 Tax=Aspergillus ibericus CBS 121593 TaxID=1448316 RepID=A0A395GJ40_9EURO|nr:DUF1772-domain-containing protein [Aspergillus ibericus CBS 121593]RAK95500.1 DUF1772-domain-containing protein [Aspergillus ibericus CBS 121593]
MLHAVTKMLTTNTLPPSFCIAQVIGLSGAAWLSGTIYSLSYISIPTLLTSHQEHSIPLSTITKQWAILYETGKNRVPPIAVLTASTFLYLAWSTRASTALAAIAPRGSSSLYTVSAALVLAIMPFTVGVMKGTNDRLKGWAGRGVVEGKNGGEEEEVVGLLRRWAVLNGVRALWPLIGGIVGLVAGLP